jgi:hypothetical protein
LRRSPAQCRGHALRAGPVGRRRRGAPGRRAHAERGYEQRLLVAPVAGAMPRARSACGSGGRGAARRAGAACPRGAWVRAGCSLRRSPAQCRGHALRAGLAGGVRRGAPGRRAHAERGYEWAARCAGRRRNAAGTLCVRVWGAGCGAERRGGVPTRSVGTWGCSLRRSPAQCRGHALRAGLAGGVRRGAPGRRAHAERGYEWAARCAGRRRNAAGTLCVRVWRAGCGAERRGGVPTRSVGTRGCSLRRSPAQCRGHALRAGLAGARGGAERRGGVPTRSVGTSGLLVAPVSGAMPRARSACGSGGRKRRRGAPGRACPRGAWVRAFDWQPEPGAGQLR